MIRKQRLQTQAKNMPENSIGVRRFAPLLLILSFLVVALFIYFKGYLLFIKTDQTELVGLEERQVITQQLADKLRSIGFKKEWLKERSVSTTVTAITVRVPRQISLVTCNLAVHRLFRAAGIPIHSAKEIPRKGKLELMAGVAEKLQYSVVFIKDRKIERERAKIAVVVGGAGASLNTTVRSFLDFDMPLTMSLVPGARDVVEIAQHALKAHKEVMIELPIELVETRKRHKNEYAITEGLTRQQIRQRLTSALTAVPGSKGVCHAVEAEELLDNQLAGKVVQAARASSVYYIGPEDAGCTKRTLILDERSQDTYIKRQLDAAARVAFQQGTAVITGQMARTTVKALRKYLPELQQRGIEFVYVSHLVSTQDKSLQENI